MRHRAVQPLPGAEYDPGPEGCGGQLKITGFIDPRQQDVIEKILRHCGLWEPPTARAPPPAPPLRELQYVSDLQYADNSAESPDCPAA